VKYWEIIADNLKKRGWSYGYVSAIDSEGRTIWIVDAHRGDGKRYVVHAGEKLTAFLELESQLVAKEGCTGKGVFRARRSINMPTGFVSEENEKLLARIVCSTDRCVAGADDIHTRGASQASVSSREGKPVTGLLRSFRRC
jgi:hypothetical protein